MFQVGLPYYLELNSGRSVSINVNKTRKHFSRNIHGAGMFPQCFPVHTGNIVSMASFCFQHANYAYATRPGILTKIRACGNLQKFCEHEQASTYLIFASNSSKGQILQALSDWIGPFDTPIVSWRFTFLLLGEIESQLVKAPLAAAINPYLISPTHPPNPCMKCWVGWLM